jgi:hypothetical protein
MADRFVSVVARVECRSEGRGEEKPVAVLIGGRRLEIADVIDRAMITGVEAGGAIRHRLWVDLEDGTRCELTRVLPSGEWRVRVER